MDLIILCMCVYISSNIISKYVFMMDLYVHYDEYHIKYYILFNPLVPFSFSDLSTRDNILTLNICNCSLLKIIKS